MQQHNRYFGGGVPGFPSWSDYGGSPISSAPPRISPERLERIQNITPFLPSLKDGNIAPEIPIEMLKHLITDLKEEGNCCFKDKEYNSAYEMYTSALNICKNLQTVHYIAADKELLSTIFSNRAACLMKMDFFKESVQDCEIALQQNRENMKAYYRLASSQKSLRDYTSALRAAELGRTQAVTNNKINEIKDFDELISEIKSHLPEKNIVFSATGGKRGVAMHSCVDSTIETKEINKKKTIPVVDSKSKDSKDKPPSSEWKQMSPKKAEVKIDAGKKLALSKASTANKKNVDASWLVGTNANVKNKIDTTKVKQKKAKEAKSQYHGRYEMLAKKKKVPTATLR